jgi:hypothetical protein
MDDGYMGSGKVIISAMSKYGIDNFKKDILETFDTTEAMYAREKEIVTDEFLLREDTYNLRRGGGGGFDYINKNKLHGFSNTELAVQGRIAADIIMESNFGSEWRSTISKRGNVALKKKRADNPQFNDHMMNHAKQNVKKSARQANTPESIEKKKATFRLIGHQQGVKNSQYGKMWITDGVDSKMIWKNDIIPQGWKKGRIISSK